MGISGNLKTMALAELLQWLSMGQKTGTLAIEGKKVKKKIFFAGGAIISSASTDPAEYLGRFLASHGFMPEETIDAAVAQQKSEQQLLGKILVNMGAISEEDLHQMLRLKAEESIYDIFTWEEGEFEFLDDELPTETMIRMHLDVQGIVLEGTRRVDEWLRIREVVPSNLCVPVAIVPDFAALDDIEEIDQQLLAWVDDDRSVEEISQEAQVSLYQVANLFAAQVNAGNLKVVRPRIIEVEVEIQVPAPEAQPQESQPQGGQHQGGQHQGGQQPHQGGQHPAQMQPPGMGGMQYPQNMGVQYAQQMPQMPYQQPPPGVDVGSGRTLHYAPSGGNMPMMPSQHPMMHGGQAQPAAPAPSEADTLLQQAQDAMLQGDLETALKRFRHAKTAQGSHSSIRSAAENGEKEIQKALERDGVILTCVPKLNCGMDKLTKLDISPQEGFMLTRVDGSFDIKSILKMSPMPQIDAQMLFWRLKKLGHIAV